MDLIEGEQLDFSALIVEPEPVDRVDPDPEELLEPVEQPAEGQLVFVELDE